MKVEHDKQGKRFVAHLESGEAELTYEPQGNKGLDLLHTFVPPEARGEGVAETLVETAFSYARERGLKVQPSCHYVQSWLNSHPEARDVVAES